MIKNKFFLTSLFVVALIVIYYSFFNNGDLQSANGLETVVNTETYRQQITASRVAKDKYLKTDSESPITDKKAFTGLQYFDPDPSYRVNARLEPFADKTQKLVVKMSDGSEEVYTKFAHAVFSLNDQPCRLLIVKLENTYTILFRDATSAKETYGGGRYLELNPNDLSDTHAILDFNKAYNPYCAYNPTYSCPIPPTENTLPIAIKAGERYHE